MKKKVLFLAGLAMTVVTHFGCDRHAPAVVSPAETNASPALISSADQTNGADLANAGVTNSPTTTSTNSQP